MASGMGSGMGLAKQMGLFALGSWPEGGLGRARKPPGDPSQEQEGRSSLGTEPPASALLSPDTYLWTHI